MKSVTELMKVDVGKQDAHPNPNLVNNKSTIISIHLFIRSIEKFKFPLTSLLLHQFLDPNK